METTTIALAAETALEEVTTAAVQQEFSFSIPGEDFMAALPIMGKGMLGIFIVIGIVIACVAVLNNLTSPDRKAKKAAKAAAKAQAQAQANINQ